MTDEEALDWLESRKEHYELDDECQELAEALGIGIRALENQKSIIEELEKIKAEIEKEREEMASVKDWGRYYGLNMSLEIVDNHISELKGEQE